MTNDEMKHTVLREMSTLLFNMEDKVNVLEALDSDRTTSGCFDLHDQSITMRDILDKMSAVLNRSNLIIPQ